jgi:arylsulfatase A-like enzyme
VASLFTSLLPRDHGCVLFRIPLDPALVTLAERLREHGYGTGAVVVNPHVGARDMHFDQGFDQFEVHPLSQRAGEVVDAALAFLDARRGQPAFLYVHTMDSHEPYRPPPPFDRRFPPPPAPGREATGPRHYVEPADRDRIIGQYDGAAAYGDQEFGRFVRALRERGLYERATIVFLSDHGEEFLDHGGWEHGPTLFDELVRVPLVVKYARGREAGRRVARQVQLVDVLPTILKSQGLAVPGGIAGRPLEESFATAGPERPTVFETKFFEHLAYGARTSEAKYVRYFHPTAVELFFDLRCDPGERRTRDAEGSAQAQALKRVVETSLSSGLHHRVRVEGAADYDLRLRTTGWIDVVDRGGLLATEDARVADDGHELVLRLRPDARRPRPAEVEFVARPYGAPVWVDGTRGGRRLRPSEIRVAAEGRPARTLPFLVPDVEELGTPFAPPPSAASGVSVWLVLANPDRGVVPLDPDTQESLKALGYLR